MIGYLYLSTDSYDEVDSIDAAQNIFQVSAGALLSAYAHQIGINVNNFENSTSLEDYMKLDFAKGIVFKVANDKDTLYQKYKYLGDNSSEMSTLK